MTIGTKSFGGQFQYTRDGANNRCWYATIWMRRDNRLRYWYPSLTLVGWRPVFECQ
jgi:hypothetical protein